MEGAPQRVSRPFALRRRRAPATSYRVETAGACSSAVPWGDRIHRRRLVYAAVARRARGPWQSEAAHCWRENKIAPEGPVSTAVTDIIRFQINRSNHWCASFAQIERGGHGRWGSLTWWQRAGDDVPDEAHSRGEKVKWCPHESSVAKGSTIGSTAPCDLGGARASQAGIHVAVSTGGMAVSAAQTGIRPEVVVGIRYR